MALSLLIAAASYAASHVVVVSPMMIALLIGVVVANCGGVNHSLRPGLTVSSRQLLRAGIVLLGLQLVIGDLLALGTPLAAVIVSTVLVTFVGTTAAGRALGLTKGLTTLVAAGFSICGAAAVAAVSSVTDSEEEDVATAIGLVTLFGSVMILLIPLSGEFVGLTAQQTGFWAGAAVHEVSQVVATAGLVSGAALVMTTAVTTKLARVVLLAPLTVLVRAQSSRHRATPATGVGPPVVPLFLAGFVVASLVRSAGVLPEPVLAAAATGQSILLAAAMFALGTSVRFRSLRGLGPRPLLLAGVSTLLATLTSLAGIVLLG